MPGDSGRGLWRALRAQGADARSLRAVLASGVLTPWACAIYTKLSLDARGLPTWDWLYFVHPGTVLAELWATAWFALPSLVLVVLGHRLFQGWPSWLARLSATERRLAVLACAAWGALASVPEFLAVFAEFHPVILLAPFFVTATLLDGYLVGLAAGLMLAAASCVFRLLRQRQRRYMH